MESLVEERKKAEFDVEALKMVWAGGAEPQKVADKMKQLVASDPVLFLGFVCPPEFIL